MTGRAIFLDRDGTINEEKGYICHLAETQIFPFAFEAVRLMNENHFKVICITNQSAIARGICSPEQVENFHLNLQIEFQKRQAVIHRFYYCPYHPEGVIASFKKKHPWRKPSAGMLLQAAKDFQLDLARSYMIGDDLIDIQAGKNAGCQTILVLTGKGSETQKKLEKAVPPITPDKITANILTAIREITGSSKHKP